MNQTINNYRNSSVESDKFLILVVDDSPANLKLLRGLLSSQYRLTFATNGLEAIERANSSQPDLILLDIMMPKIDGLEVCKQLKESSDTRHIPIIFLTANDDIEIIVEGFKLGGVDYITKPFQKEELLVRLQTHLKIVSLQRDLQETIQQLEQSNQHLEKLSHQDGLTQIANRRYFDHRLQEEWQRLQREEKPLSLILLDIDYFKQYNDYYGHLEGDECLKNIAKALSQSVKRSMDVVARYGGEEFAVILPNTAKSGAIQVAQEIQILISQLEIKHNPDCPYRNITVSMGIATIIPTSKDSINFLISQADTALYQSKEKGRNQYCILPN